jgi:hypothetical protein
MDITIETHFVLGEEEEQVFGQCREWITANLGANFKVGEGRQMIGQSGGVR